MKLFIFCLTFVTALSAKIYDCFMFNHEFDVLEIHLAELYDVVDHFVLVESHETQLGSKKPFYFEENKDRFQQFLDKIIHVKVTQPITSKGEWVRENFQRDQIIKGFTDCSPNDYIIVCDMDEIVPAARIKELMTMVDLHGIVSCEQDLFTLFLNGYLGKWKGPVCAKYKTAKKLSPNGMRSRRHKCFTLRNCGWHFSSVLSPEEFLVKVTSNIHCLPDLTLGQAIELRNNQPCIPVDSLFPQFVLDHYDELAEKGLIKTHYTTSREAIGYRLID